MLLGIDLESNIVISEAIDTEAFIMDSLQLHTHFAKHVFMTKSTQVADISVISLE